MDLPIIIKQIKLYCPTFAQRVAGAAQFKQLQETSNLTVPCAFVIPMDDNPEANMSSNGLRQKMTDSFAVVVAVSNVVDERGQAAMHNFHDVRAELFAALLGFRPSADGKSCNSDFKGIEYEGGSLLALDRGRAWYQFEFGAEFWIGPEDGWQIRENTALPHFDGITINVDFIDPSMTGTAPDGQIDSVVTVPKSGNLT